MNHHKQRSLSYYVYLLLIIISVIIAALFGMSYSYALRALREQVYETNKSTLEMYSSGVNDSLHDVERFLSGFGYNNEDLERINAGTDLQRYTSLSREHDKIKEALPSYSIIDGFFLYNPKYNLYASAFQTRIGDDEHALIRQELRTNLPVDGMGRSEKWFSQKIGSRYYLFRTLYIRGNYVGAWINVENLLSTLYQTPLGQDDMIYIYDKETPLSSQIRDDFSFDPSSAQQRYSMVGGTVRYLAVSSSCVEPDLYVVALISDASIRSGMSGVYRMLVIVIILLIAALILLSTAMRGLFIRPMEQLTHAIRQVRDGKLGTTVDERAVSQEFSQVTRSFNEMSAEIKELKISVYEEKLKQQQIYLEYLKQQITPHFYINCLNTIYSMAGLGKNDLVRKLAKELSQHLRYTMNSQDTVELGKEIEHVHNYLALTEIRYPGTLTCEMDVDPDTEMALLPPLTLQSFVENTVKHEMVMGEPMLIHLSVQQYWQGSERRIHINIWDTGGGYPEDFLTQINVEAAALPDEIILGDGQHVGISNTIQRLMLLFNGKAQIRFSNREGAGAQCDINIPFMTIEQTKTEGE